MKNSIQITSRPLVFPVTHKNKCTTYRQLEKINRNVCQYLFCPLGVLE